MITSTDPAPFNDTTTTNYNLPSRTTTVSVPAAGGNPNTTALTTADLLGRKVAEHLGNFPDATYTYDPVGNLLTSTDPAGVTTTYQYNPFSQVTKTTRATGDNTYPASSAVNVDTLYNYDAAGRLSSTVDPRAQNAMDANHTWTYVYDGDGRLISSTLPAPLSTTTSIVYDDAGERLKITDGAGHARFWTYDVRGRATKFTDA